MAALVATFLPLRVKGADLRELLLAPRPIDAEQARTLSLANRVVPRGEIAQAGEALAADILAQASSESIARTKRLLLEVHGLPLAAALDRAVEANAAARATDDCRHGIRTFLATKQPPAWR